MKLLREELAAAQEAAAAATGHAKQFEMLARSSEDALASMQADHNRFKAEAEARWAGRSGWGGRCWVTCGNACLVIIVVVGKWESGAGAPGGLQCSRGVAEGERGNAAGSRVMLIRAG